MRPQDMSATLAYAMWGAQWPRSDRRLFFIRCSLAVPDQGEVERVRYFLCEST